MKENKLPASKEEVLGVIVNTVLDVLFFNGKPVEDEFLAVLSSEEFAAPEISLMDSVEETIFFYIIKDLNKSDELFKAFMLNTEEAREAQAKFINKVLNKKPMLLQLLALYKKEGVKRNKTILNNAFAKRTNIYAVTSKELTQAGMRFDLQDKAIYIMSESEIPNKLIFPAYVDGIAVRKIGSIPRLPKNGGPSEIFIPDTVTEIEEEAFYGFKNLSSIDIPNSVTSIRRNAFYECTGLSSLAIPNSVTSIGTGAFCRCTGLTSVIIPNSVTSIESGAFEHCDGLASIISSSPSYPVYDGRYLVGNTTKSLIAFAPAGVTEANIPDGITSIEDGVFCECDNLAFVNLPETLTSIGKYAFWKCKRLVSLSIPKNVTEIGDGAFGYVQRVVYLGKVINKYS